MVKVIKSNGKETFCAIGIHLYKPSKQAIEDAKEDAYAKGFKTIWVHTKFPKKAFCRLG